MEAIDWGMTVYCQRRVSGLNINKLLLLNWIKAQTVFHLILIIPEKLSVNQRRTYQRRGIGNLIAVANPIATANPEYIRICPFKYQGDSHSLWYSIAYFTVDTSMFGVDPGKLRFNWESDSQTSNIVVEYPMWEGLLVSIDFLQQSLDRMWIVCDALKCLVICVCHNNGLHPMIVRGQKVRWAVSKTNVIGTYLPIRLSVHSWQGEPGRRGVKAHRAGL